MFRKAMLIFPVKLSFVSVEAKVISTLGDSRQSKCGGTPSKTCCTVSWMTIKQSLITEGSINRTQTDEDSRLLDSV